MRLTALAILLALAAAPAAADGVNLLSNADFEGGDNGTVTFPYSNSHYYPYSSAPYWSLYNNHAYTDLNTQLLADGVGESANHFIHVGAGAQYSGIDQTSNGAPFTYLSADIKLDGPGYVFLQAVSNNFVTWNQSVDPNGAGWQHIVLDLSGLPYNTTANELRVVSGDYFGNSFYVDNVYAGLGAPAAPVPEPGEWAMLTAGLGIVGALARRRNRGVARTARKRRHAR